MKKFDFLWGLSIFLMVPCAFSWDLRGEYSELGIYKIFNIKRSFTLKCVADEIVEVVWFRGNQSVAEVDALSDRHEISVEVDEDQKHVVSELTVSKAISDDSGLYSCRVTNDNEDDVIQEFMVVAQIAIKAPKEVEVVEGETAKITCTVVGYRPIIEWLIPESVNDTKIYYEKDTENVEGDQGNVIVIEDSHRETDRANYICQVRSGDEAIKFNTSTTTFLRVKNKNAWIYPFTGLCIVIFLFILIVVISEAHRRKLEKTEENDEVEPQPKKTLSIRQRK